MVGEVHSDKKHAAIKKKAYQLVPVYDDQLKMYELLK